MSELQVVDELHEIREEVRLLLLDDHEDRTMSDDDLMEAIDNIIDCMEE